MCAAGIIFDDIHMLPGGEITRLLDAFRNGEPEAEARLIELTYRELRKIAAGHVRRERSARSFQATDLVHFGACEK